MAKNKLKRFNDLRSFSNVLEPTLEELNNGFILKGSWGDKIFNNRNPISLELGCGKGEYVINLARKYPNQVLGFICQKAFGTEQDKHQFMYMTPGVRIGDKNGTFVDQQYRTPVEAIQRDRCHIIIVGSGISSHPEPSIIAEQYRKLGWKNKICEKTK